MKDQHKFIALAVGILTLVATIHILSVKKMEDNNDADAILRNQIEEQQKVIDAKQVQITQLQRTLANLKGDVVVIDNKSKETKTKYKDEKRYIDLATPSQQSTLLSTNLTEFKDLDKKGYFDLPEGR
jgi:septal ring factor EnvC (AmiA/AmiB activator)